MRIPIEACNEDGEQVRSFEHEGKEIPDSRPMEIPLGCTKPESLTDIMRKLIHRELSDAAYQLGAESFDEAGDFDIEDDPLDPLTPWEALFEPAQPQSSNPPAEVGTKAPPASPAAPSSSGTVSADLTSPASPVKTAETPIGPAHVDPSGTAGKSGQA